MTNSDLTNEIIEFAKKMQGFVVERRRDFHQHPEVKFEEKRTGDIVEELLQQWGYGTKRTAGTGVIGTLKCSEKGKTVALRADIDALDVKEENDVPYKSAFEGKMHACGHDAHAAMLLGAAKIISDMKDSFMGTVKLIFQPGEEGGAGAKQVVEEGHIDDVDAIFGIHVWVEVPSGVLATRKGPMMASSDGFQIKISGKGGHAAHPHLTNDPTAPAADIYNAFHKLVSRAVNPFSPAVITLPVIEASHGYNIIPDSVEMKGTLRTFDSNLRDMLVKRMQSLVECYSKGWGCNSSFEFFRAPYPPLINDPQLTDFALDVLKAIGPVREAEMTMGGEDFAFYTQKIPGVFVQLGIRNEEKNVIYPHHHPKFDVDEDVLWQGVATYVLLAKKYLELN
ncbi:amidohydrolase [Acetomicrobium sp.]|uniref:M20 metallopeptidase family protein n=1 Tax=Acetomicrobium sp. TaxID=1872099 RepID=UPI001BCF2BF8|nr:amidohydrolase [Acetomicrobium sp.]